VRSRLLQLAACALTVALGLGSRASGMPPFVLAYAGDALYAVLVFGLLGLVAPRVSTLRLALAALAICVAIEVSQAFHPAWLDALRARPYVALVLGRGFLWSDLACYAVGVGVAAGIERLAGRSPVQGPPGKSGAKPQAGKRRGGKATGNRPGAGGKKRARRANGK
jgi:hypothetical protein